MNEGIFPEDFPEEDTYAIVILNSLRHSYVVQEFGAGVSDLKIRNQRQRKRLHDIAVQDKCILWE